MRLLLFARAITCAVILLHTVSSASSAQIPPDDHYLIFETEHFRVVFPDGLEDFARQAAASAEWAYDALSKSFLSPPRGKIGLVITDHTDAANASATPIPRNRVTLIATPDIGTRQLNYYTDWLDVTLAHELTHIFHLDHAEGFFWNIPRALFGRVPLFFPAFYQPQWVIEGLATYYESRLTGAGRAYGSFFDMLLTTAAYEDRLRPVDAANGLTPNWPAGSPPYAYGSFYFKDLAEQYGDSAIGLLARKGGKGLPYTVEWAARPAFGDKLTVLWSDWEAGFTARVRARIDSIAARGFTSGRPLSASAWQIPAPRFSPDSRSLVYTLVDPREDPATVVVDVETGAVRQRRRRNGSGTNAWSLDSRFVYLQAPEFRGRYRLYTDLYQLDVESGKERRITKGARIGQPDMGPDGHTLVAIQVGEGTNRLVTYDLETGVTTPLTQFVDSINWQRPRFSPDGSRIAAGRWVKGGILDIVILDARGRVARQVTRDDAADVVPVFSPDGRYLLWSSDRHGVYNIYAADLSADQATDGALPPVFQVTNTVTGALDLDVSPDGRWLAYVAHHADGYRVEIIPYDPASWHRADASLRRVRPHAYGAREVREVTEEEAPTHAYSPFPSVWPTSWLPLIITGGSSGTFIGATSAGTDYINRHTIAAVAGWRTGVGAFEGALAYFYRGWGQPSLRVTASQEWETFLIADSAATFTIDQRERQLDVAATWLWPRRRTAFFLTPVVGVDWVHRSPREAGVSLTNPSFTDLEGRLIFGFSRARSYARSVSLEKGYATRLELTHRRLADDLDRWRISAELTLTGYNSFSLFGYANHVLAGRLAVAASDGHDRNPESFPLGGIPGRPVSLGPGVEVGGGADYPIRGFTEGVERGDRIVAGNLEYRFPLAIVGRGYKLWPFLIQKLSGTLFVDGGAAWTDSDDVRGIASTGAEFSIDLGIGYALVYRFRLGLARQLAAPSGISNEWDAYLTAGVAF